jgi:hypothetical protein
VAPASSEIQKVYTVTVHANAIGGNTESLSEVKGLHKKPADIHEINERLTSSGDPPALPGRQ